MNFYILNRQEEVVGILSNEGENGFLYSAILKEAINKMNTLEMDVASIGIEVAEVKPENYILFKDNVGDWKNFIIREVEESHGTAFNKHVYSECSSQELIDYVVETELQGQTLTPSGLFDRVIQGTRWEAGEIDVLPAVPFPAETKNKTVLEVIHSIADTFNLKIKFRIEVMGGAITRRLVDIKHDIGNDYGKRFEYTKDITSIERKVESTKLKTAIIPYGAIPEETEKESEVKDNPPKEGTAGEEKPKKPPIDIRNIKWEKPANPVNKPLGQNYLEIPEATAQWGYKDNAGNMKPRFIYYENTEMKTPEELIQKAYEVLSDIAKPVTNYKLDVLDLFALTGDDELSFESVRLGDIVSVIDKAFKPAILLRTSIISREIDLLEPKNSKIELGSFIRNLVDSQATESQTNAVQNLINYTLDTGLSSIESKVTDVSKDFEAFKKVYSSNELNYNWIKNSDFSNSLKYYDVWNGSDLHIENIHEIPFFNCGGSSTKGNFTQTIEGGNQLLNNNVTLSAFVYGQGILSIEIHYKDLQGNPQFKGINSDVIPVHDGWGRFSLTGAIKQEPFMQEVTGVYVSFIANGYGLWTGLQLNLGTAPSKYVKNPHDKYGRGIYDQVRKVSDEAFKNGLGYVYLEEEDGVWVYDKPQDGKPTKMTALKGGMLAIGHWNMQTQQWDMDTFINGQYVNASCINTGKLNADLIKTGKIQSLDGSVQINMEDGRFSLGVAGNGNTTHLSNDSFSINYADGSYTRMDKDGFSWYRNGMSRPYHCLATTISFVASGNPDSDITIQLPDVFKGKDFSAQAVLSDTYADSWNMTEPWVVQRMVTLVSGKDINAGTVTVKGYRTDKNYKTGEYRRKPVAGVLFVIG